LLLINLTHLKKMWSYNKNFLLIFLIINSTSDKTYDSVPFFFEIINYLTITNENTDGGIQTGYLSTEIFGENTNFCFCSPLCSKSFKVVAEIEFNNGTS